MPHQTTNPAGAKDLLAKGYTYVDVRTVEEFQQGHVPGAYNVPIAFRGPGGMQPNPDFVAAMQRHFAKDAKLVFGCRSGGRSQRACELLEGAGYSTLVNMYGGFHGATDMVGRVTEPGWSACGYETTLETPPGHSWNELSGAGGAAQGKR